MNDGKNTFKAPDGTVYRINEDGTYTKIRSAETAENKSSEDNTIIYDGKKFRIEDDGSFTYLGEVEREDQPVVVESPYQSSYDDPDYIPNLSARKRRGCGRVIGIALIILGVLMLIIFGIYYIVNSSSNSYNYYINDRANVRDTVEEDPYYPEEYNKEDYYPEEYNKEDYYPEEFY